MNRKRQSDSQSALDAQPVAQEATPTRRAFGGHSLQRWALACFGVLGTGGLLILAGCPANLEDPGRFNVPGLSLGGGSPGGGGSSPTGGGTSMGGATTVVPAPGCATDAFKASCVMCHAKTLGPLSAGLDLESDNVAQRLVNVAAMHQQAEPTMCSPAKLIDPVVPANSWLLAKVNGTQGGCGSPMPLTGTALTADQKNCISMFVMSEASSGATHTDAAGAAAGGAAATGSGGAPAAGTTAGSGGM